MRMRPKRPILRAQIAAANPAPLGVRYGSGTSQAGARGPSDWILPCWNLPSGEECCLFENPDEILCGPAARRMRPGSIANVCPPGQVPMNGRCVAEVGPQLQYGQRYSNPPVPGNPLPPPTMWHTPGSIGSGVLHGMDGSTRQVELYGYQHQGGTNGPIWVNIASSSIAIPPGGFPSWPPPLPPPDWVRASYLPTPPHAAGGHPVRRWVRITALWNNSGPGLPPSNIPIG